MLHTDPAARRYSHSSLSQWMLCQRRYYWGYVRGIVPDVPAPALHFGQAVHAGLSGWHTTHDPDIMLQRYTEAMAGAPADLLRTPAKGELILKGYAKQWPEEPFTLLADEIEFELPMPDGSTLIGRTDRVIQWGEKILVMENKTTSGGIGAYYFKQFSPNLQIDMECYATAQRWGHCEGALIDVLQVCKTKEGYARDVQDRTPEDLQRFEGRYRRIVSDLERAAAQGTERDHYLQNQLMCTYYGECPYRKLCLYNNDALIEGHYKPRVTEEPTHESE